MEHPVEFINQRVIDFILIFSGIGMVTNIVKKNGVLAFYNGLSASVLRQGTYSTTRFAVYESGKRYLNRGKSVDMPFIQKVMLAGSSGLIGSLIGLYFNCFFNTKY